MKVRTCRAFTKAAAAAFFVLGLSTASFAQPWTPPLGVPAPTFGVTEQARSAPDPWTAETPGFYYIDNTNALASDSFTYGTPARPRRSIPAGVAAGSVVQVAGGPYNTTVDLSIGGNGTAAAPIFYRGVGKPKIVGTTDKRVIALWGSYVIAEGFEIINLQVPLVGTHQAVRDCEIHGMTPAPGGSAVYTGHASDIVVFRNYIHHNGSNNSPVENDIHGVLVGQGAQRVWVVDNHMYANGGSSIQVNSNAELTNLAKFVYIARNLMHEDSETAIAIKSAQDVIISQNNTYGYKPTNYPHSGSDGTAILIDDQNAWNGIDNRIWILFNTVHDTTVGIRTQSFGYLIGNLIYSITNAAVLSYGPHDVLIEHNTMIGATRALERFGGNANNKAIFINNVVNATVADDLKVSGSGLANCAVALSLLPSPARINWGGTLLSPLATYMTYYPCIGCREGDPRFVNLATGDLRLGAGSPGLGGATPSAIYAAFQTLYGVSIAFDYAGRPRPGADGKWDMGAFESDGGITPPGAPTNPKILR